MISYIPATTLLELKGIISLQSANLHDNLTQEQIQTQGFLTVSHSLELLNKMNEASPHIIAKEHDTIAGFCLSMTQAFEQDIPILVPMFETMNKVMYAGKELKEYNYITVGQVCVAEGFRGKGVFGGMYQAFRHQFERTYDMAVTEISTRNTRSLAAHAKVGFIPLHQYTAPNGETWEIVVWDWEKR